MKAPTFVHFVTEVLRVQLTPAQRALARVAFDRVEPGQLEGDEAEAGQLLFGPVETIPPSARSVLVAVLGARSGKSYVFVSLYSLWRALFADLSTLAPGELAVALIVSRDMKLGRQSLRYALGAAKQHTDLRRLIDSETSDAFVLTRFDRRPVSLEVLPASRGGGALRGRSLVSACLDEAAFFHDENYVVNDIETFRAVSPRVLPGGLTVVASTPFMETGLLHNLYTTNWGAPRTALAAHAPTLTMLNSPKNLDTVEREIEIDPDNARREFGAEFVAGGASLFFPPGLLRDATVDALDLTTGAVVPGCAGGDIGLVHDSSAFVAVHRLGSGRFATAEALELRPKKGEPLRLSAVVAEGAAFARKHRAKVIYADHHVLEPAREHLPPDVRLQPVPGGMEAKTARFMAVRQALKEERLTIPRSMARLRAQLAEVSSVPIPGGGLRVVQRRRSGAHGDVASAWVLAAWAALRTIGWEGTERPRRERKGHPDAAFLRGESARRMRGF